MADEPTRVELVAFLVRECLGEGRRAWAMQAPIRELRRLHASTVAELAEMERRGRLETMWDCDRIAG